MNKNINLFGEYITKEIEAEEKKHKYSERAKRQPKQGKGIRLNKKPFLIKCSPLREVNVIYLVINIPTRKEKKLRNTLGKILKGKIRNDSVRGVLLEKLNLKKYGIYS